MAIFGFQKGKIDIKPSKFNYSPGETIEGVVELKLKKSILAKELSITIIGEQKISQMTNKGSSSRRTRVFDFKQSLDGEKEYLADQPLNYPFQIKLPDNLLASQGILEGGLGTVVKIAQAISGTRSRVSWYLIARLAVSGFDVTKRVQINIG